MAHLTLWAGTHNTVDAGTWVIGNNANHNYQTYLYNSTHADEDAVTYKAYMDAGTYTCRVLGVKADYAGILKVKIDGTEVVSWDKYKLGAESFSEYDTTTSISVATDGLKDIQVIVDGKNASSSNHYILFTYVAFWRTA